MQGNLACEVVRIKSRSKNHINHSNILACVKCGAQPGPQMLGTASGLFAMSHKLLYRQSYVASNASQQGWRQVSPTCTGTVVTRPSGWRKRLCEPRWRTSSNPSAERTATTSLGLRTKGDTRTQATTTICVPTNSPTRSGTPSLRIMAMTSLRLSLSSSNVSP